MVEMSSCDYLVNSLNQSGTIWTLLSVMYWNYVENAGENTSGLDHTVLCFVN